MSEAKQEFEKFLQSFHFSAISIPVISNVHARPYEQDGIHSVLADQIDHSVRWNDSIRFLLDKLYDWHYCVR
jgi:polyketide biosynthesis malonyl-CoA-[acyl-carrier-protein] transacylase